MKTKEIARVRLVTNKYLTVQEDIKAYKALISISTGIYKSKFKRKLKSLRQSEKDLEKRNSFLLFI